MKLIGVDIDDEEVKRIRENRIINLPVYGDTTGTQVDFMAKPTADSTQEKPAGPSGSADLPDLDGGQHQRSNRLATQPAEPPWLTSFKP